jgi:catechol 2,3-dioxygenase-like lactoylglutathione lyase family enzyme
MIVGMNHFTVIAEDREKTLAFYVGVLGLREGARPDLGFDGAWLYGEGPQALVHLYFDRKPPEQRAGVIDHMAFTARGVKAVKERFDAAGIRLRPAAQQGAGTWQLFCHDRTAPRSSSTSTPREPLTANGSARRVGFAPGRPPAPAHAPGPVLRAAHLLLPERARQRRESCGHDGAREAFEHCKARIKQAGLAGPGKVRVNKAGCLDRCAGGRSRRLSRGRVVHVCRRERRRRHRRCASCGRRGRHALLLPRTSAAERAPDHDARTLREQIAGRLAHSSARSTGRPRHRSALRSSAIRIRRAAARSTTRSRRRSRAPASTSLGERALQHSRRRRLRRRLGRRPGEIDDALAVARPLAPARRVRRQAARARRLLVRRLVAVEVRHASTRRRTAPHRPRTVHRPRSTRCGGAGRHDRRSREHDEVVPLAADARVGAAAGAPVIVFPGVGHFFHGQIALLKGILVRELRDLATV